MAQIEPRENDRTGLAAGTRLGHYVVQKKLGGGGMGDVYEAVDEKLQRSVAIKILPAELSAEVQLLG